MMMLPLLLASVGLIASILGIIIVKLQSAKEPASALRSGTLLAPVIFRNFCMVFNSMHFLVYQMQFGGVLLQEL